MKSRTADGRPAPFTDAQLLAKAKERIEKELCDLKHTTAGVAARFAAEDTYEAKRREKEIAAQASISKCVSRTKSKDGKLGKFMKKCARIYKQPSKVRYFV